jgi:hypothetical protein
LTTTRGAYPWSFVTQIFHSGQSSHGGEDNQHKNATQYALDTTIL